MPGEHSRRTGPATIRSAVYHRTRDSIEAHLTIVLAALAVSRWIEAATGWSIHRFARTARRYHTIQIQADDHIITAADPLPEDLRDAIDAISSTRGVRTSLAEVRSRRWRAP